MIKFIMPWPLYAFQLSFTIVSSIASELIYLFQYSLRSIVYKTNSRVQELQNACFGIQKNFGHLMMLLLSSNSIWSISRLMKL